MKLNVGDLVKWDGHDARIAVIMEHPSRYLIEYTMRQSDVSGSITFAYGRTKIVKEGEVEPIAQFIDHLPELEQLQIRYDQALETCYRQAQRIAELEAKIERLKDGTP